MLNFYCYFQIMENTLISHKYPRPPGKLDPDFTKKRIRNTGKITISRCFADFREF